MTELEFFDFFSPDRLVVGIEVKEVSVESLVVVGGDLVRAYFGKRRLRWQNVLRRYVCPDSEELAMRSLKKIAEDMKIHLREKIPSEKEIFLMYGKQSSPYPELDYFESIIAIVVSESDCYALQEANKDVAVSWETRAVHGSANHSVKNGDLLYLAHSTLEPYTEGGGGNPVYGVIQSPSPTAVYCRRDVAEREASD